MLKIGSKTDSFGFNGSAQQDAGGRSLILKLYYDEASLDLLRLS